MRTAFYRYLYDPSVLNPHSSMPSYRFLFAARRVEGSAPAANALVLDPRDQPSPGYEVVPTSEGQALVAYLLSLKKDYDLPDERPGAVTIPKSEDAP